MSTKNIIAIDIGYGNTKLAWSLNGSKRREFIFTSQTAKTTENSNPSDEFGGLDRIMVNVNGQMLMVGPDLAGTGVNELQMDYANSDAYQALVVGALHYISKAEGMPIDRIDFLVLGLPVSNFSNKKKGLIDRFTGPITIPNANGLQPIYGKNSVSVIKKVAVIPQPMGSLLEYMSSQGNEAQYQQMNLIIDPGYLTVDWLMSKGINPLLENSGAFNGGVSAILDEVRRAFMADTNIPINQHAVDVGLRDGYVSIMGKRHDFTAYRAIAEKKASSIVALLLGEINRFNIDRTAGNAGSIDNVILTGGGALYFEKPMREQFPGHFIVLNEPVMGNVKGFLEFGKRLAMQLI